VKAALAPAGGQLGRDILANIKDSRFVNPIEAMSTMENQTTVQPSDTVSSVSWVSYLLHFVVAVAAVVPFLHASVFLLIVAFIADMVMQGDASRTFQESHYSWRLKSVVIASLLYLVTSPLFLLLYVPGWIAWGLISLWFLYRIVKGMIALSDRRPV
jgi:uncharacterized membrane protein